MVTRDELTALDSGASYPAVSILLPTIRAGERKKGNRIKTKNLVAKAIVRLQKELGKREADPVVKQLKRAESAVDWKHVEDGLALFASRKVSRVVYLPFKVRSRIQIDQTFASRDLVYALNRRTRYRVVVLSEKPTRLYEANQLALTEVLSGFPMEHQGPGGASRLPGGLGVNVSQYRDDAHRAFFRKVIAELERVQAAEDLPLVVVGIERYLAFFHELAPAKLHVVGHLAGNHDKTPPHELGKLVWPVFRAGAARERTEKLAGLQSAVDAGRYASGIAQIWRAAVEKRVGTLLVEKDYHYAADLAVDGVTLANYTGEGPRAFDDVVDEAIEHVLAAGGEVFFYDEGTLDTHQQIAAILRY
jgi:uncharacterized protein YejL (UPF0352 family)